MSPSRRWIAYTPLALCALARYYLYVWAVPAWQWRHVAHRGLRDYWRRTACSHCGRSWEGWTDAAFGPLGRCRGCGRTVAAPAWTVEVSAVALMALAVASVPDRGAAAATVFVAWLAVAATAAVVDSTVRRLPLRASQFAAGIVVVGFGLVALAEGSTAAWERAMLAGAVAVVIVWAAKATQWRSRAQRRAERERRKQGSAPHPRRGVGGGDVPFVFGLCATAGWISATAPATALLLGLCATAVTGVVAAVVSRNWRVGIPYGPGLVAAAAAVWLLAP